MNSLSAYNIPWELIVGSFQDSLSVEEKEQLQHWLAGSPFNQEKYDRLKHVWNNNLDNYPLYQAVDETAAWNALQGRLGNIDLIKEKPKVVNMVSKKLLQIRRRISIAAVFVVTLGLLVWYTASHSNNRVYETAYDEQKNIKLPDGSTVILKSQTRIETDKEYNKTNRTLILTKGEAFFEVKHQELPFIVEMGTSSVKDIGTSFTIQRGADSVRVTVASGKVAFIKNATKETQELSAGMTLASHIPDGRFGKISSVDSSAVNSPNLLYFNNTVLTEVIKTLQKVYNKRIEFSDTGIAQKRFTAHLDGLGFEKGLEIICTSLNLEYNKKDSVYWLKVKK
ncbi:MAG TPA: FecR domain-containing protein [Chitinophagaceae bacterium]